MRLFVHEPQKKDTTQCDVFFLPIAGFRLRRVVGDAIADLRFSEDGGV